MFSKMRVIAGLYWYDQDWKKSEILVQKVRYMEYWFTVLTG